MKRALIGAVLALMFTAGAVAAQQIDYQCLSDCTAAGYLYRFCKEKCSFDNTGGSVFPSPIPQPAPRIDYNCQADCLGKGYRLQFCQQQCSY